MRAFTAKAVLTGLAGALLVSVLANVNDNVLHQTLLIGNHLPIGPFILICLLSLGWNPLAGRWWRWARFSVQELVVVLGLLLVCSWLPTSGFYRYFHRLVIRPELELPSKPNWQKHGTLAQLPEHIFPLHRDPARLAQLQAVDQADDDAALDRPSLRLLAVVDPRLFAAEPGDAELASRERLARAAAGDPAAWAVATAVAAARPALRPAAGEAGPYATAFARVQAGFDRLLPAAQADYEVVYGKFVQGIPSGDRALRWDELPLRAWLPALAFWAPLVVSFMLAIMALTLLVHRQWVRHEQLSYPLATVTGALVERTGARLVADVFRSRLFWWGALPVLGIHLLNYLNLWFPTRIPAVPLYWHWGEEFKSIFPSIQNASEWGWGTGRLQFVIIGITYFIAAEVSLSMGLGSFALLLLQCQVFIASSTSVDGESMRFGSYLAYAGILGWTGRSYYGAVLVRALGLRGGAGSDREGVWAARILLAAVAGLVATLVLGFGMDWLVALLFAATLLVLFLVLTRVVCESGIPFIQAGWYPGTALAHVLGFPALGPAALVLVAYLGPVLAQDPRECLMPYAATANRLAERNGVDRLRLLWWGFAVMCVALAVGCMAWLWVIYGSGSTADGWANGVPSMALDRADRGLAALADTGRLEASSAAHGLGKLPLLFENTGHGRQLGWLGFGALAVVATALMRFRFGWWPIHPILFLVWGTYPNSMTWASVLIGCLVKEGVVRFAGGRIYQQLKPLFIGLIIGEVAAVGLTVVCGFIYYYATGIQPRVLVILPS